MAGTSTRRTAFGFNLPWCSSCPLRNGHGFKDFAKDELAFMDEFKQAHRTFRAGSLLLSQGASEPRLFTLYSGWAVKYRALSSGERQLLSVVLPGDLLGLESIYCKSLRHTVEAVTDVSICEFDPDRFEELMAHGGLATRVSWFQALDQRHIEERLTAVGACGTRRRAALLFVDLLHRLERRHMVTGHSFRLPLTQQQIAEALGVTTVHLSRVLRDLDAEGLMVVERRRVTIHDVEGLRETACLEREPEEARPLI